jgi:hypothetical protein
MATRPTKCLPTTFPRYTLRRTTTFPGRFFSRFRLPTSRLQQLTYLQSRSTAD